MKKKTISGVFWSSINTGFTQASGFIVGIILARQLGPNAFGLIASISILIGTIHVISESGLGQALIQNNRATQIDYSTAFFFNILLSSTFYMILFILSPTIANFYNKPILEYLIKVIGVTVIIQTLSINQHVKLSKEINFKLKAKISIPTTIFTGMISVWMVYNEFGIWSYVNQLILNPALITILLWINVKWLPTLNFSFKSLKNMFSFGSKLIFAALLDIFQRNILNVIIGKYFSMNELGYFNRSEAIKKAPTLTISKVLQRVFFPLFSEIKDDDKKISEGFIKSTKYTAIISFPLIFLLIFLAEPLILTLLGNEWMPMVPFLKFLSLSSLLYPIESICQVFLKAKGNSKKILQIELMKGLMLIPIIIFGVNRGVIFFIYGMVGKSLVSYLLYAHSISKYLNYSLYRQIIHLSIIILRSIMMGLIISLTISFFTNPVLNLILGVAIGFTSYVLINRVLNYKEYIEIKSLVFNRF